MSQLSPEQRASLTSAVRTDDRLRRLVDEIARLHLVVFHANERLDPELVRRSAEQILIAELACRYQAEPARLLEALRAIQARGQPPHAASRQLATAIHSYFTTPLGIVMRQDLFGSDAVFVTPDAYDWLAMQRKPRDAGAPPP